MLFAGVRHCNYWLSTPVDNLFVYDQCRCWPNGWKRLGQKPRVSDSRKSTIFAVQKFALFHTCVEFGVDLERKESWRNHMQLTIEIPFEAYRRLVSETNSSSPEFGVLEDAYVERRQRRGRSGIVAQIQCDRNQAQSLLNTAVHASPEAAAAIVAALSISSRPH